MYMDGAQRMECARAAPTAGRDEREDRVPQIFQTASDRRDLGIGAILFIFGEHVLEEGTTD
jgi:hypothetical protein